MLRTNGERLKASFLEMGSIGATPLGGVTRLSLTDEDKQGRDLLASWAGSAGLAVRVDDLGNMYLRLEGADPAAAPVLIGSHNDSVPKGGKFDGTLGVLIGLEVVRTLMDAGVRPSRPIEVVNFTNEEGARRRRQLSSRSEDSHAGRDGPLPRENVRTLDKSPD